MSENKKEIVENTKEENTIASLFEGLDLSEEFKKKSETLIETKITEKVNEIKEQLEEEYEQKLNEEKEAIVEGLDAYLSYIAEEWMKENKEAVESTIKLEIAESFMNGIKKVFEEHYVEIPEEKVDILDELTEKYEEVEEKYNRLVEENIKILKENEELKKSIVFESLTENIEESAKEKIKTLAEGIEYEDIDEYKEKLKIIVENYAHDTKEPEIEKQLTEEYTGNIEEEEKEEDEIDPFVKSVEQFADLV